MSRSSFQRPEEADGRRYPFLMGIDSASLLALLWRNRFRVGRGRLWDLVRVANVSMYVTLFGLCEDLLYRRKIARTRIGEDPIFILGHWRSGTTFLQKLFSLDERYAYPTLLQCMLPNCFLSWGKLLKGRVALHTPPKRPMDDVELGADEPLEDEFALMKTTLMSPLLNLVFPGPPEDWEAYLDFSSVHAADRRRWERSLVRFLKKITLDTGKRIVVKNPAHSFRIRTLLRLFPGARFVCMLRDPYAIFASTCNVWRQLAYQNRLQDAELGDLKQLVFSRYTRMFKALQRDKACVPEGHYCELRFEDLEADPIGTLRLIYEELGLPHSPALGPRIEAYLERNRSYRKNEYHLTDGEKEEIYRRWKPAFEAHGYRR